MYEVLIPVNVRKIIRKLPQKYQVLMYETLLDLKEDPYLGKSLTRGLTKQYNYRVGIYRIIYKVKEKDKIVLILKVGHRSTVYN